MATRSWLRAAALAIALVALPGCLAPTLPVPPPTADSTQYLSASNQAVIMGHGNPGAYISCLNLRTNTGVIVLADTSTGAYTVTIDAVSLDRLQLWQSIGSNMSASLFVTVDGSASAADH